MAQSGIRTLGKLVSVIVGWLVLLLFLIGITWGIFINIGYSHYSTVLTYIGLVGVILLSLRGMLDDIGSTLGMDILGGIRNLVYAVGWKSR